MQVDLGPLRVSRLGYGTLTLGPLQRDFSVKEAARLLCAAAEAGVTFFDTAQIYGTYGMLRELLKQYPDCVISTKAYAWDATTAKAAYDEAVREMGRPPDLFMLHEQESEHTLRGHEAALRWLHARKAAGDIRAVGLSTHHVAAVRAALRFPIDIVHPIVNARGLGIRDGTRSDMEAAIAKAHAAGIGVFAMKALGGGHLIGDEAALPYVLALESVDAVAVGMQSLEEIAANVAVFTGAPVSEGLSQKLRGTRRRLAISEDCVGCGACARRCGQGAIRVVDARAAVDDAKCVRCGYCGAVCPMFCIKVL